MKKNTAMILFLIISAAVYYLLFFIAFSSGGPRVYSITAVPVVCLGLSMIFGVLHSFKVLYPLINGILCFPLPLIFFGISPEKSAAFAGIMALISLVGLIIGTALYAIVNKACGVTSRQQRKASSEKPSKKSRSNAFKSEKPISFSQNESSESEDIEEKVQNELSSDEDYEYVEYTNEELLRRMRSGNMNTPVSPSLSKERDRRFDTQRLSADFQTWFNKPFPKDIKEWASFDGPSITEKKSAERSENKNPKDYPED